MITGLIYMTVTMKAFLCYLILRRPHYKPPVRPCDVRHLIISGITPCCSSLTSSKSLYFISALPSSVKPSPSHSASFTRWTPLLLHDCLGVGDRDSVPYTPSHAPLRTLTELQQNTWLNFGERKGMSAREGEKGRGREGSGRNGTQPNLWKN